MADWQWRAVCPSCSDHFDGDSAKFFGVCPICGHRGEWDFGRDWTRQAMRWVPNVNPCAKWWKPSTWASGGTWEKRP
jgi:hypothetical protein